MPDTRPVDQYLFLATILLFGFLSWQLLAPYLLYIAGAAVLAYLAYPLHRQVAARIRQPRLAAATTLILSLVLVVGPTIIVTDMIVGQARAVLMQVGSQTAALLDISQIETEFAALTGQFVDFDASVRNAFASAGAFLSEGLPGLITSVIDAIIGVFIVGTTMYYLFKDGDRLADAAVAYTPLPREHTETLRTEIDSMARGILLGHFLTATIQGVVAGIGLWAVGIPNVVFWTFVMILLGIIPLVGNFLVWGPAGLYLIVFEQALIPGIALLAYGSVVLLLIDNAVRARVVSGRTRIHPLLVMLGVIGGLPFYGLLGVVLGPLTLGIFITLLRVYHQDAGT